MPTSLSVYYKHYLKWRPTSVDINTVTAPWFFFIIYLFFTFFFIVVQLQLSPFHLTTPLHPTHANFPPLILTPFGFDHVSFIVVPENPFPFPFPLIPSHFPYGYCQLVLNLNVSGYILLAYLFCWLGSTYRWDHMVFVFHHLAYFTQHNALQFHPCCHTG